MLIGPIDKDQTKKKTKEKDQGKRPRKKTKEKDQGKRPRNSLDDAHNRFA